MTDHHSMIAGDYVRKKAIFEGKVLTLSETGGWTEGLLDTDPARGVIVKVDEDGDLLVSDYEPVIISVPWQAYEPDNLGGKYKAIPLEYGSEAGKIKIGLLMIGDNFNRFNFRLNRIRELCPTAEISELRTHLIYCERIIHAVKAWNQGRLDFLLPRDISALSWGEPVNGEANDLAAEFDKLLKEACVSFAPLVNRIVESGHTITFAEKRS